MCLFGGVYIIYIIVFFLNICKYWRDENFENMVIEVGFYYQKIFQIYILFLLMEMFIYDVLMLCLVVEFCVQMWGVGGVNCWECVIKLDDLFLNLMGLINCEKWLGFMLGFIVFVSVYKGK